MIQDIYPHHFHNEYRADAHPSEDSPVLCFSGQNVLAVRTDDAAVPVLFPEFSLFGPEAKIVFAFCMDETEYYICLNPEVCTDTLCSSQSFDWMDIRKIRRDVSNYWGMILFTGIHLHQWYTDTRFCGTCGKKTEHDTLERAMVCPACGKKFYPRLMPAVIVGVIKGNQLLVTQYREGYQYFALIAGFAEIGETLEETVAREVMEETGIRVKNIRYYKSQPWGIAQDLLAGFFCEADGDDPIQMDAHELRIAKWCCREDIELQPDSFSLTNEMMQVFQKGYFLR